MMVWLMLFFWMDANLNGHFTKPLVPCSRPGAVFGLRFATSCHLKGCCSTCGSAGSLLRYDTIVCTSRPSPGWVVGFVPWHCGNVPHVETSSYLMEDCFFVFKSKHNGKNWHIGTLPPKKH